MRTRRMNLIAIGAMPALALALTACSGGANQSPDGTTAFQNSPAGSSSAAATSTAPTSASPESSVPSEPTGNGDEQVIRAGDDDFSDATWEVTCHNDEMVSAGAIDRTPDTSFVVLIQGGEVESVVIGESDDTATPVTGVRYNSPTSPSFDPSKPAGSITEFSYDRRTIVVVGEGYDITDDAPTPFEIRATCAPAL